MFKTPANLFPVMALLSCVLLACSSDKHPYFDDATVVLSYVVKAEADGGAFTFHAGPYEGGTAVLSGGGMAFWVKDGVGYVVNEKAREAAPDLEQAPDPIKFDLAFQAAARAGE